MELAEVVNTQYAFPVGFVLICAVFVFAFGFKSSNPPTFSQLVHAADERKTAGKKRKLKDKKSIQNNVSSVANDDGRKQKSDNSSKVPITKTSKQTKIVKDDMDKNQVSSSKQQSSKKKNVSQKENVIESDLVETKNTTKDGKQLSDGKKVQSTKDSAADSKLKSQEKRLLKEKNYNIQQIKTNKNLADARPKSSKTSKSKLNEEKPIDFDDGEWEQAISRKEKKSKKKDEEALIAANTLNSGNGSLPANQTAALPKKDSVDVSAPADNADTHVIEQSNTTPTKEELSSDDVDLSAPVSGNTSAVESISGDTQKKETATTASNSSGPSSSSNEKPKSSKSKGKNKETAVSAQKDISSQENGNISTGSAQPSGDESTKSKKKKKQSNTTDNKEGKTPIQPVEALKLPSIDIEPPNEEGEIKITHDIVADTKVEPEPAVVFDELGDVWKEAKAPKKNKKKVRKDQ